MFSSCYTNLQLISQLTLSLFILIMGLLSRTPKPIPEKKPLLQDQGPPEEIKLEKTNDLLSRTPKPDPMPPQTRLLGERTPEEIELEKGSDFRALQRFRYRRYVRHHEDAPEVPCFAAFFRREESLRSICQEEIALKKEPHHTPSQIHRLKELHRQAWFKEREWRYLRSEIAQPPSVLERGFEDWRSNPRWYMHDVLVENCINRGGCCGRDCGCCVSHERETTSVGKLGIGHCTVECDCCRNARGFELTEGEMEDIERRFGFLEMEEEGIPQDYFYQHRLFLASVWGLLRNDQAANFHFEYREPDLTPIFKSHVVKREATSTADNSETLFKADTGEESDSTLIVI